MNDALIASQRELFAILKEFFKRATGEQYTEFASRGDFGDQVRARAHEIEPRGEAAFRWAGDALAAFYNRERLSAFSASRAIGGAKFVLGGSSRVALSTVASTRRMLLYADTILVPDPILPWLETDRAEERFKHVLFLEAAYNLLHLSPLIEADLPYPAVVVFPSWEKALEEKDDTTRQGIEELFLAFLSRSTGREFESATSAFEFASRQPDVMLQEIERAEIFVAPGQGRPSDLRSQLEAYKAHLQLWRSQSWLTKIRDVPDAILVLNGLLERIGPQYHLFENSAELAAHPILTINEQWFYYRKIAELFQGELTQGGLLSPGTNDILASLNRPDLEWLGNIGMEDLVRLRQENENEQFRRKLDSSLSELYQGPLSDIDRTAANVGRAIAGLMAEHQAELRKIRERYRSKHLETNVLAWTTLAVTVFPALAPFASTVAPAALIAKYGVDKVRERGEHRGLSRSLLGVLASAARK